MCKILGTDDAVNSCECCGKTGLKFTVVVEIAGEIKHYGSVCATRHTGKNTATINREIKVAEFARLDATVREFKRTAQYLASEVAIANAHRTGVAPGKAFRDATRDTSDAARNTAHEIAAKHGVSVIGILGA